MELPTSELIGMRFSPYTEKARWALNHHKKTYSYSEHLILFGMPILWWKARKISDNLTVPMMVAHTPDGERLVLGDSWDIALYTDKGGANSPLFPADKMGEIHAINALSEQAFDAGRALYMDRLKKDRAAQAESLPNFIPKFLRPFLTSMVHVALKYISWGFGIERKGIPEYETSMRECLKRYEELLAKVNFEGPVLGKFSYADIVMTTSLQFVSPVEPKIFGLTPKLIEAWTDSRWETEFPRIFSWRKKIYEKYRH